MISNKIWTVSISQIIISRYIFQRNEVNYWTANPREEGFGILSAPEGAKSHWMSYEDHMSSLKRFEQIFAFSFVHDYLDLICPGKRTAKLKDVKHPELKQWAERIIYRQTPIKVDSSIWNFTPSD